MSATTQRLLGWITLILAVGPLLSRLLDPFPADVAPWYAVGTLLSPLSLVLFALGNIIGYETKLAKILLGLALPFAVAALPLVLFNRG